MYINLLAVFSQRQSAHVGLLTVPDEIIYQRIPKSDRVVWTRKVNNVELVNEVCKLEKITAEWKLQPFYKGCTIRLFSAAE